MCSNGPRKGNQTSSLPVTPTHARRVRPLALWWHPVPISFLTPPVRVTELPGPLSVTGPRALLRLCKRWCWAMEEGRRCARVPSSAPQGGCPDPGLEASRHPHFLPLPPPARHCQGCSAQKRVGVGSASRPIPRPGDCLSSEACQSRRDGLPARWAERGWGVSDWTTHWVLRHTHTGLGQAVTEVISPNLIGSLGATLTLPKY